MAQKQRLRDDNNVFTIPTNKVLEIKGTGETLFEKMKEYKDNVAHIDALTGETHTYDDVLKKAIRVAIAMRKEGIKPNDVISICSYNTMDCPIPFFASFFIGAISANLDPLLPLSDTTYLLQLVCPKIIFVVPEALELIENALKEAKLESKIVVFGETSKYLSFSQFLIPSEEECNFRPYKVENVKDTAIIVFSSGTTGLPKGICLTHYGVICSFYHNGLGLKPKSVLFTFSNFYWIAGVMFSIICTLYGYSRLLYPRFHEGTDVWNMIKKFKISLASLNPHQALDISRNGRPEAADTSSLATIIIVGGPVSLEQMQHIRKCFNFPNTKVGNSYGQTEMNAYTLRFNEENVHFQFEKPLSVGRPMSGYTYKVIDLDTEEILGPNQEGELLIKSEFGMSGYYKMDSSAVWDKDGFMRTGDIVYYDEDECFFVVDRVKELLKYKMWHISPVKVEMIVCAHPAVHTCVVTGVPHPIDGDHLLAVVVLKELAIGKVTEDELRQYVDDRVGDQQKLRAGVKFVKSIPLTVTDKASRMKLKQLLLQEKL